MTHTLELRDIIAENISGDYQLFPNDAPPEAVYPYAVFEVSSLTGDESVISGYLEVNVWDRYNTYSRVDTILDKIEAKLKNKFFSNEKIAFRCFYGDRNHIIDEDKEIKRTREKFLIRYSIKEE